MDSKGCEKTDADRFDVEQLGGLSAEERAELHASAKVAEEKKAKKKADKSGDLTDAERAEIEGLDPEQKIDQFDWPHTVQRQIAGLLVKDKALVAETVNLVRVELFDDVAHAVAVGIVQDFFRDYGDTPSMTVILEEARVRLAARTRDAASRVRSLAEVEAVCRTYLDADKDRAYWRDRLIKFAKTQEFKVAMRHAAKVLKEGREHEAQTALERVRDTATQALTADAEDGEPKLVDFFSMKFDGPRLQWIIPGLLAAKSVTMLHGPPKVGKSTLNFATVASLVTGRPWCGGPDVVVPRAVIYIDYENPDQSYHADIMQQIDGHPVVTRLVVPSPLPAAITYDSLSRLLDQAAPEDPDDDRPVVIIFDSARSAFEQLFPNDNKWESNPSAQGRALRPIQRLCKERNIAVEFVHHDNADGVASGRGDWLGAVDFLAHYTAAGVTRTLEIAGRFRLGEAPPEPWRFIAEGGLLRLASQREVQEVVVAAAMRAFDEDGEAHAEHLRHFPGSEEPPVSLADIAEQVGKDRTTVYRWAKDLGRLVVKARNGKYRRSPAGDRYVETAENLGIGA